MPKRPPSSPDPGRFPADAPNSDIPCTCDCFGVPPQSLSATLWQILPQLAVGGAVLLVSCVAGDGP